MKHLFCTAPALAVLCLFQVVLLSCGNASNKPAQTDSNGRTTDSGAVQTHTTNSLAADTATVDSKQIAENENFKKFTDKAAAKDAHLVVEMVTDNIDEIRLAQLALQRSKTPGIQQAAQEILRHQSSLLDTLRAFALRKNISVPSGGAKEANEGIRKLDEEKPETFDKAWAGQLEDSHSKNLEKCKQAAKEVTDADLKKIILSAVAQMQAYEQSLKALKKSAGKQG
jgi:putative membrane protein